MINEFLRLFVFQSSLNSLILGSTSIRLKFEEKKILFGEELAGKWARHGCMFEMEAHHF